MLPIQGFNALEGWFPSIHSQHWVGAHPFMLCEPLLWLFGHKNRVVCFFFFCGAELELLTGNL